MSAPTMSQTAGLEAILHGERYVKEMVHEYDRRRKLLVHGLNSLGLDCFEPQGAFYAFPDVRELLKGELKSCEVFAARLLEKAHVALTAGCAFGTNGFIRISYATAFSEIEKTVQRLTDFVKKI
jgi:aminotransferase